MPIPESINMFKFPKIVAETKDMPLDEWRRLRKDYIGGSDAAPILGASRYASPVTVYFDKIAKDRVDDEDSERMAAGRRMEPVIAEWFAEETGKHVVEQKYFYQHPLHPWMSANIDYGIYGENAGLECKNSAFEKDWEDGLVPDEYYLQCQHYMAVTDASRWYLAYCISGWKFRYVVIERNEEVIAAIIKSQQVFWNEHVKAEVPPLFDGSEAAKELIKHLYPSEDPNAEPVQLPDDFESLWEEKKEIDAQIKALKEQSEEIGNQIKAALGNSSVGYAGGLMFTYKTQTRAETVTKASSFRVLRSRKAPKVAAKQDVI